MTIPTTCCKLGLTLATAAALVILGASAIADYGMPLVRVATAGGVVLAAERNGRTLYARPPGGIDRCTEPCSFDWPPFLVSHNDFPTDGLTVVHRPEGVRQWSLGHRPLHFFIGDATRGETRGDGMGRWRALRPKDIDDAPSPVHAVP